MPAPGGAAGRDHEARSREDALAEALVLCGADKAVLQRELRTVLAQSTALKTRLNVSTRCLRTLHAQRGVDSDGRGSATVLVEELLRGLSRLEGLDGGPLGAHEDRRELVELHRTIAGHEESLMSCRAECEELLTGKVAAEAERDSLRAQLSKAAHEGEVWALKARGLEKENATLRARLASEEETRRAEGGAHLDEIVSAGLAQEALQKSLKKCQDELAEERGERERAVEGKREKEQSSKNLLELVKELESSRGELRGSLMAKEEDLTAAQAEIRALQIKSIERERLLTILDQQCAAYELTLQLQKTGKCQPSTQSTGTRGVRGALQRRPAPGSAAKKVGHVRFRSDKENEGPGPSRADCQQQGSPQTPDAKDKEESVARDEKKPLSTRRASPGTRVAASR